MYGRNTFGQSLLLARRLVEAGTRFVEVNWPKVANSDNHSWDVHTGLSTRMKTQSAPMLDAGLSGLISDLDQRGLTGAARAQFLEACEAQARSACEAGAKKQKLTGTERENFLVRCKNESIGVR
jgi:hypothetical protein